MIMGGIRAPIALGALQCRVHCHDFGGGPGMMRGDWAALIDPVWASSLPALSCAEAS